MIPKSLPAPWPSSAIPATMNPKIIKGIRKPKNSPNMELKVLNMRMKGIGVKLPIRIPKIIAMIILVLT